MEELLEDFENAVRQLQNLNDELRDVELNNDKLPVHSDEIEFALEDIRNSLSILELEARDLDEVIGGEDE